MSAETTNTAWPDDALFLGKGETQQFLKLKYANRHGLITGATGTGKTVTLQILAESFSDAGVPVFAADVKGDLSGISVPGSTHPKLEERAETIGFDGYDYRGFPTIFWDLFGEQGHPIRTTITEIGPLMLARMLRLSEVQEGVLNIAFAMADAEGLPLLDLKDLRALLTEMIQNRADISAEYGHVSKASIAAIQRALLVLDREGASNFFAEPALKLADLMRTTADGKGMVNLLAADRLIRSPRLYATFLLWLLSELFEELPEQGDSDRPRLVFFFDEAHLLFKDAPDILLEKVEQVVRLIRSKGVGVYFVTQNPDDVPGTVLGQLANRVQHALRAYTPRERKAVRAAAESFRENPSFDTAEAITQLGIGEALVSTLEKKAVPSMVDRTLIRPPRSQMGPVSAAERAGTLAASPVGALYDQTLDRHSAYEMLQQRAEERARAEEAALAAEQGYDEPGYADDGGYDEPRRSGSRRSGARRSGSRRVSGRSRASTRRAPRRSSRQSVGETLAKSVARSLGTQLGKSIVRGIFGGTTRRKTKRRTSSRRRRR